MLPADERHRRKCVVCRHPDRDEIEEEFIHWHDVWYLAKHYKIADYRSIYRHARVFGLIERRRENRRAVLDRILEGGPGKVTSQSVIQAIRAYSCLTDDNRWVEPPTRVEYTVAAAPAPSFTNLIEAHAQKPTPQLEPARSRRESTAVLDVAVPPETKPDTKGDMEPATERVAATSAPTWPNWNGSFA